MKLTILNNHSEILRALLRGMCVRNFSWDTLDYIKMEENTIIEVGAGLRWSGGGFLPSRNWYCISEPMDAAQADDLYYKKLSGGK